MARGDLGPSWVGSIVDPSLYPLLHTDTTAASDEAAPSGTAARTSFAVSPSPARRWELHVPEMEEEARPLDVWVAVRSDQNVETELELRSAGRSIGHATVAPTTEYGAVRLGRLAGPGTLDIEGWARRTAGTGALYWDRVWVAPADSGFIPPIPPVPVGRTGEPGEPTPMATPRRAARMALIVGGTLALIGGGIAATVALTRGSGSNPPTPPPVSSGPVTSPSAAGSLPGEIVFSCSKGNNLSICVMNPDGSDQHTVVQCGDPDKEAGCGRAALSPDGTKIAYAGPEGSLAIVSPDGKTAPSPPGQLSPISLAWSPQGDRLAFNSFDGSIKTVKADGTDLRTVIKDPRVGRGGLAWSPDGTELAFVNTSGGIDAVTISSREIHPIIPARESAAPDAPGVVALTWTPQTKLLFEEDGPTGTIIGEVNPDGTGLRPLLPGVGRISPNYSSPSWGPDDVHFCAIRDGRVVIATVDEGVQDTIGPRGVSYVQWGGPA